MGHWTTSNLFLCGDATLGLEVPPFELFEPELPPLPLPLLLFELLLPPLPLPLFELPNLLEPLFPLFPELFEPPLPLPLPLFEPVLEPLPPEAAC